MLKKLNLAHGVAGHTVFENQIIVAQIISLYGGIFLLMFPFIILQNQIIFNQTKCQCMEFAEINEFGTIDYIGL